MEVNSYNIEFGYELLSAVPYAYELYQKGQLTKTVSGFDTEAIYYFSPEHEINPAARNWFNTDKARYAGLPYTTIHKPEQPAKTFPPYKEHFQNKEYRYKKPTLCICNRMNIEWGLKAINYFDEDILEWLFANLKTKYEIIYFPVAIPEVFYDGVKPMKLDDDALARKHGIKVFTDLCRDKSWNETMLKVFANCEHYVTMNGGYSIMASLFGGTNIIYSKPGPVETREIKNRSFWRWYPNHANQRVLHVPSFDQLKEKIQAIYIEKIPCVNVLVRTHRANYLANCMASIAKQSYQNINIVLICDTQRAVEFTRIYNARMVQVKPEPDKGAKPPGEDYGKFFPFNRYLDYAQKLVTGFIMFLDDDDQLQYTFSIDHIIQNLHRDKLTVWKVDFKDGRILPGASFKKEIKLYDITGIGFAYHSSQINKTDWSEWKRADYRTAKRLSQTLKVNWIDEVLTSIQDRPGNGTKPDLLTVQKYVTLKLTFPDGKEHTQIFSETELETCKNYFKNYNVCIEQVI